MFLFVRVLLSENFGNIGPYLGVIVTVQKPPKRGYFVHAELVRKHFNLITTNAIFYELQNSWCKLKGDRGRGLKAL